MSCPQVFYHGVSLNLGAENQVARAEAMLIANTDNQYLVPTSGKPIRGLIQDHIVAGVWMTSKDTFFTREEYHQLLYGSLCPEDPYFNNVVQMLPPAIGKPHMLWTGKQLVSRSNWLDLILMITKDINYFAQHNT